MTGQRFQLVRQCDGQVLLPELKLAVSYWSRLAGLQFQRQLKPQQGLWLAPCSSLHTCFMRFPIDVVMLDAQQVVVGCKRKLRPWRICICPRGTKAVVETAVGAIEVAVGDRLEIDCRPEGGKGVRNHFD